MSLMRLNRNILVLSKSKRFSTKVKVSSEVLEDEYTATPQYPQILDLSPEKERERKREERCNEIKNVKTVEEKQIKLNMPRYYGFKTYKLCEDKIPCNSLPMAQYITKTHLINNKDLPEYYQSIEINNIETISKDIEEALLMEVDEFQRRCDLRSKEISDAERESIIGSSIVRSITRILNNGLIQQLPHILNNEVDIDPRLETTWVVGGMNPDENIKRLRRGRDFGKRFENEPIDRTMCYIGSPSLTIRAELPLPCIIPPSEAENSALEVPYFEYDPRVVSTVIEHRHAANIPGFWPGDNKTFGLLSYFKTGNLKENAKFIDDENDIKEAYHRLAILSSFAWLHSQANHLGFTTYNDITYPLVTQTILTNGRDFKFYIYQLNTILMHFKNATENPKRNVCWSSEDMKLYEEVKDGKIVGFNEDVVKILVRLYSNEPKERLGVNLRPYLSQEEKIIADYEDNDKRKWLEDEYKHLVSNRPRHREVDEIYAWEKIYKIDHQLKPTDKRSRFFELFEKPWKRRLDDRLPKYIPRALRPDLPRHKGRYAKDYWP